MFLINRWTKAAQAASTMRRSPPHFGSIHGPDWRERTQAALDALGPNPSPNAVEALWPSAVSVPKCSECGRDVGEVVEIGEEPDYESHTAYLCGECLVKALMLLEK